MIFMEEKLKILIVEDDPNDRELVLYQLRKITFKYIFEVVQTRADFEDSLRRFKPDIILSDYSLPQFNGLEAFEIKQVIAPGTPFIILSGTVGEERAVEMIKSGITDYVLKDKVFALIPKINRALTEAREKEEKLRAELELQRSESRLSRAQQIAHLGSWEMDLNTGAMLWSDEACRIFELEPRQNNQSLDLLLSYIHPEDLTLVLNKVREAREQLTDLSFYYRIICPAGNVKSLYAESKFDFAPQGKPVAVYGIVYDVTKIKRAEEEILQLNAELEERVKLRTMELETANKQLESFTSTVSHDLRSPLQVINGYASILSKKFEENLTDDGRKLLHGIQENTQQMGQLIDDLLNFSKLGRTEPVKKLLDMNEVVLAVISQLKLGNENLNAHFRFSSLAPALGDKGLIYQVWMNLLSNAVKYSRKQENPMIEIGMREINGEDVYYAKDNGVGFDMRYYDKLFRVFQRLHKQSEFEGTGVGLALVHAVITKHGGKIWAEGKVNHGATFYFTLPGAAVGITKERDNIFTVY